jgi:hypothetical protein
MATDRKNVYLSATVDATTARLLTELADRETEGNRSQFLRRAVRAAAVAHGLAMPTTPTVLPVTQAPAADAVKIERR